MIIQGDCLEVMKTLDDNSIDAVITDPPYNIGKADWDKIPDYIDWCIEWMSECARVTKDNGCLYFFHNDMPQISKLMVEMEKRTPYIFRQFIVWNKRFDGAGNKGFLDGFIEVEHLRNYQKMAEYCLYYTTQTRNNIADYLKSLRINANLTCDYVERKLGYIDNKGRGSRLFYRWENGDSLPAKKDFVRALNILINDKFETKKYEDLRYTFNNQKTHHSVWNYEIAQSNGHITPKPVPLIENIIRHSTNEGATVLDPFAGSGTTAIACKNLNREYILIEKEKEYIDIINNRLANYQPVLI